MDERARQLHRNQPVSHLGEPDEEFIPLTVGEEEDEEDDDEHAVGSDPKSAIVEEALTVMVLSGLRSQRSTLYGLRNINEHLIR